MSLKDTAGAIADALSALEVENLQVWPRLLIGPTPPTLDIYPGDPLQEAITFGQSAASRRQTWTVRARVAAFEDEAGQDLLLDMMEADGAVSVIAALEGDPTLGGTVASLAVSGPSEFRDYPEGSQSYVGCQWTVSVLP